MDCDCRKDGEPIMNGKGIWYLKWWCRHKAFWCFEVMPNQDLKKNGERLLSEEQKKASAGRK